MTSTKSIISMTKILLAIILIAIFTGISLFMLPYLAPFLVTLTLAVLIEPINQFLMRWKRMSRLLAVTITTSISLILFFGLVILGGTKMVLELIILFRNLPQYFEKFEQDALAIFQDIRDVYLELPSDLVNSINKSLSSFFEWGKSVLENAVTFLISLLSTLPGFLILLLIMVVSFILMSYHLPKMREQFLSLFSSQAQEKVTLILSDLNDAIIGFVRAQFILSAITYFIAFLGLALLGVKYALAIALIIVVVDVLPILGTGSVIVPWAGYVFYQGETTLAVGLLLLFLVITVVRRIIEPKILGSHIGLGSIATIMSLYLGFELLGGLGIFLGPILVIVFKSIRKAGLLQMKIDF
jgi:sporulation integral membrane protein YtvI